ncbi:hypothetical protein HK104_007373, partial [Borealophlyctis nickersoniae]
MAPIWHHGTDPKLESHILALTQKLVESIVNGDWATYSSLCAPDMTAFEPEGGQHQ